MRSNLQNHSSAIHVQRFSRLLIFEGTYFSPTHSSNKDLRTVTSFHHQAISDPLPFTCVFENEGGCRILSKYFVRDVRNATLSEG